MSAGKILLTLSSALLLSACSGGGGGGSPRPSPNPTPVTDTTPPETSLSATPAALANSTAASFTATATEAGSVFEASLDGAAYATVNATFTLTVADGAHTVNVRARDSAGNTDATPATFSWTVDATPPNTHISSGPPAITSLTTATFTFTSEAGATFEVNVGGGGYVPATSPFQLTGLADGVQSFAVRARDAAGNVDPTADNVFWLVDTVAPETSISASPPALTNSRVANFSFSSELGGTYQLSVDGSPYVPSGSNFTTPALGDGAHTLNVRAFDLAGNMDATPATHAWTVDTQAPDTALTTVTPPLSASTSASFAFTSEAGATFQASVDGGAYAAATSPVQLTGLANGAHSFSVRATDAAGNVETQPATFNWQVTFGQPTARILFPTAVSRTDASQLQVRGTANDPQGIASVSVNGVTATSTDNFANWSAQVPIVVGDNTLTVSVTDTAGDSNPNAASVRVANRGAMLYSVSHMSLDIAGDRVLAYDNVHNAVLALRRSDGYTSIFSDSTHGTGPSFDGSSTFVVDAPNNRLIVVIGPTGRLFEVDLATGNRTQLFNTATTSDTRGFLPMVCNSPCTRLYGFTQSLPIAVFSIDLQTGARAVISGGSVGVGSGPAIQDPEAIALDALAASPRLFITDEGHDAVIAVDIASGVRSLFAHASVGSGGALSNPRELFIEPGASRLLLSERPQDGSPRLLAVDLATGNRSLLNDGSTLNIARVLDLDEANSRLVLAAPGFSLHQLDVNTGNVTRISDNTVGTGPRFSAGSLLLDGPPGNRSLLLPASRSIVRADLATGARTTLLTASYDAWSGVYVPTHMAFDTRPGQSPNQILFTDGVRSNTSPMTIFSGNLVTGTGQQLAQTNLLLNTQSNSEFPLDAANGRFIVNFPATQLSGVEVATGIVSTPLPGSSTGVLSAMALDAVPGASTRLLGVDNSTLYAFDLTGSRSIVSSASVGTGPAPIRADGLSVDAPGRRALAVGGSQRALQWIDLTNGNRSMVSGLNPSDASTRGSGPLILPFSCRVVGDFDAGVAYVSSNSTYVLAVDLVSGDRVITAL